MDKSWLHGDYKVDSDLLLYWTSYFTPSAKISCAQHNDNRKTVNNSPLYTSSAWY